MTHCGPSNHSTGKDDPGGPFSTLNSYSNLSSGEKSCITVELWMIILFLNALLLPVVQVAEYFVDESMWRKKKWLRALAFQVMTKMFQSCGSKVLST